MTICCTSLWRTTSRSSNYTNEMPSIAPTTFIASTSPDVRPVGRSICVMSPVITAFDPKPEPRQEHLHLFGGRVLRLVEDDERVVQRAAAHERNRRDLDRAALDVPRHALDVEHVVERIVERPQIRIHFLLQVARQKAELLARLDRRTRQDDAADLLRDQKRDRLRHRQIGLAGAGRADAEHDVVLLDRVEISPLVDRLRRHAALARRASGCPSENGRADRPSSSCATRSEAVFTSAFDSL